MNVRSLAWLLAADALFLWMFLSADPLERLAADGAWPGESQVLKATAFRFAADWRHGMAGNSPLYMPGFFALAVTAWIWASGQSMRRLCAEGALVLAVASAVAWTVAPAGASFVVQDFARTWQIEPPLWLPPPGWDAMLAGLFTAITWTAFVAGCRLALTDRSWRPLAPVPVLTALLALGRPWTVDDFSRLWLSRALAADPVALGSLVAVPLAGSLLVLLHRSHQRTQTAFRHPRTTVDPCAPPRRTAADVNRMA